MTTLIITAFIFGFAGSIHCIGMCGPIALSLSFNPDFRKAYIKMISLQTLGRISTYVVLGALVGAIGEQLALVNMQQTVSIITGLSILLIVLMPAKYKSTLKTSKFSQFINEKLKRVWLPLVSKRGLLSAYLLGLINGLLPCGLLYLALITASASGSIFLSMLFMLCFGLATSPALLCVFITGSFISKKCANWNKQYLSAIAVVMAILFIFRGMELGIPYISPEPDGCSHCEVSTYDK